MTKPILINQPKNKKVNEIQNKLSADPGATVLGIIALLISLVGCCCGILAIPAIIMSIIGLIWASKSAKAYALNPESYTSRSYSSVKTAKILNIIALVLSSAALILSILWFGSMFSNPEEFFEKLERSEFYEVETETETYEYESSDDASGDIDTWQYEEEMDSIPVTIEADQVNDSI